MLLVKKKEFYAYVKSSISRHNKFGKIKKPIEGII